MTPGLRCKEHSFNPAFEYHGTVFTVKGSILLLCCQENRTGTPCLGPVGPLGCDVEDAYRLEFTKGSKGWKWMVGTQPGRGVGSVSTEVEHGRKTYTWCLCCGERSFRFGELRVSIGGKGDRGQDRRKDKPQRQNWEWL